MELEFAHDAKINTEELKKEIADAAGKSADEIEIEVVRSPQTRTLVDENGVETVEYLGYELKVGGVEQTKELVEVGLSHAPDKTDEEEKQEAEEAERLARLEADILKIFPKLPSLLRR